MAVANYPLIGERVWVDSESNTGTVHSLRGNPFAGLTGILVRMDTDNGARIVHTTPADVLTSDGYCA